MEISLQGRSAIVDQRYRKRSLLELGLDDPSDVGLVVGDQHPVRRHYAIRPTPRCARGSDATRTTVGSGWRSAA